MLCFYRARMLLRLLPPFLVLLLLPACAAREAQSPVPVAAPQASDIVPLTVEQDEFIRE